MFVVVTGAALLVNVLDRNHHISQVPLTLATGERAHGKHAAQSWARPVEESVCVWLSSDGVFGQRARLMPALFLGLLEFSG